MNDIFKGKWILRYDPATFHYRQVLETLVNRDKPETQDIFHIHPPDKALNLGIPPIKTISLSYPVLSGDKRWESLHLTASSLFLGSALANSGFEVKVKKQALPVTTIDPQLLHCDLIGFTLFEDLFLQAQELLSRVRNQYRYTGIIAAGGPLITLSPLPSTFHLPGINLLVRGEAELVLPGLIDAIAGNDLSKLLEFRGFLFQIPGTIIISCFNEINRPTSFPGFHFNLDFLDKTHLETGLEINLSRGCKRGCSFCSAVQGKALRKLPGPLVEDLLTKFSEKLAVLQVQSPGSRTVNINDDDILQDPDYAGSIFQSIKKHHFRLWGIQTSINSFFSPRGEILQNILDLIQGPSLYVEDHPLVWAGTDTFLKPRGKRLGKPIPDEESITRLVEEFEKREIRNYHYWISSDHLSGWEEFTREFIFIYQLRTRFEYFGLLPHSPFVVPYPASPLYKHLIRSPGLKERIKYKRILESSREVFVLPLVERVETRYRHLNRLLDNEKLSNRLGFFDYLKQKDYLEAMITLYNFLKLERMDAESIDHRELAESLSKIEAGVEEFISQRW